MLQNFKKTIPEEKIQKKRHGCQQNQTEEGLQGKTFVSKCLTSSDFQSCALFRQYDTQATVHVLRVS